MSQENDDLLIQTPEQSNCEQKSHYDGVQGESLAIKIIQILQAIELLE